MKLRRKYELTWPYVTWPYGRPVHTWSVVGAQGGLHVHIHEPAEEGRERFGGIEIHYRHPPDYMANDPPGVDKCWLLGGPCWHDGSSMQASEFWIPFWESDESDHVRMLDRLAGEYRQRFISAVELS